VTAPGPATGGRRGWLRRWGVSIASLALGLLTLLVFRRGLPHVGWIVGYLLLLWLLVAVLAEARVPLETRGHHRMVGAAEYTIQTLYHNLFLFVLPAYFASATLASVNGPFVAAVALGALVTAVDPWYRVLVRPWRWIERGVFAFSIFAALNVALPLVGVRPIAALLTSAGLSGVALAPALRRRGAVTWRRAFALATGLAAVAITAVWLGRAAVPPAPMFLARAVVARDVSDLEPVEPVRGALSAAALAAWGGVIAYTAVHAPAGLRQAIEHVWRRDGALIGRVPLSPVLGGRAEGFRTWSRRAEFSPPVAGRYTVDVLTESGQLIGRLRFTVTP
jgi:uncharacterized membrane protein YvlD (DUF360 family)